jgi:hypothetical protein
MNSEVRRSFPDTIVENIKQHGGYSAVLGFDYNWRQGINLSGDELATFINWIVTKCGRLSIDIEAHSEGVPVSMSALTQTRLTPSARQSIKHLIALGGPIMGTPIADDAHFLYKTYTLQQTFMAWPLNQVPNSFVDLLNSPFITDLRVSNPGDNGLLDQIRQALSQNSINDRPYIVVVGGDTAQGVLKLTRYWLKLHGVAYSDGFIPLSKCARVSKRDWANTTAEGVSDSACRV